MRRKENKTHKRKNSLSPQFSLSLSLFLTCHASAYLSRSLARAPSQPKRITSGLFFFLLLLPPLLSLLPRTRGEVAERPPLLLSLLEEEAFSSSSSSSSLPSVTSTSLSLPSAGEETTEAAARCLPSVEGRGGKRKRERDEKGQMRRCAPVETAKKKASKLSKRASIRIGRRAPIPLTSSPRARAQSPSRGTRRRRAEREAARRPGAGEGGDDDAGASSMASSPPSALEEAGERLAAAALLLLLCSSGPRQQRLLPRVLSAGSPCG